MNKTCKIVLMTMFKNESKNLKRMLDSTKGYIDYYVFQNNGSNDGSEKIAEDFLNENNYLGHVYVLEEGWISFGWNRDHLIQHVQNTNHGCDWIFSIDCDEILEIDSDFNWNILKDYSIHSFEVTADFNGNLYQRARLYNAKFTWRFNHDLAHETIYMSNPDIGENFNRHILDYRFRQIGYPEGQSWENPHKFLFDALKFEHKLIQEKTLLSDMYHFWYIGKSYFDCFKSEFPLGKKQQQEYAKRSLFYFKEFINILHNFEIDKTAKFLDEKSYFTMVCVAEIYFFLEQIEEGISTLKNSEQFCPERNDHLIALAEIYLNLKDFESMFEVTSKLMLPERKNPYPRYNYIINKRHYHDTDTYVKELHDKAVSNRNKIKDMYMPSLNKNFKKRIFVVDNFYVDPFKIREYALGVEYSPDIRYYKGSRSIKQHIFDGTKEIFESIMGEKIQRFHEHSMCGRFQICTSEDPIVYHNDDQKWAAMIYLSPDAPFSTGTKLLANKLSKARSYEDEGYNNAFDGGFFDSTKFEVVDNIGNVFNRLIIFNSRCIHAASQYFGQDKNSGRLTHLFFFD